MDVFTAILRILIPLIRHILSYDCSILSSGGDADSLGKTVQTCRKAHTEGLCVSIHIYERYTGS
jgi:hypothetical protein